MTIVRWDPFRNLSTIQDRINRMFEDVFSTASASSDENLPVCAWKPVVDIYETEKAFIINAELPGVKKENISVEVKDNVLTLKGERNFDKQVSEENYYRRERCYGSFHRSFTLRDIVTPESIKAKYKDGVLEVEIPKAEDESKHIKVNIE